MSKTFEPKPLAYEYRGDHLDLTHFGYLAIVDDKSNLLFSVGDPEAMVFYRSASKPLQALPVIAAGLDKKYGLTEEESTIFSGSHAGEGFHVAALQSIFEKAGLKEEMLCVKPTIPHNTAANEERIKLGLPPRKFYHNCAGKHGALMLLQRHLGGKTEDYWKEDAPCQQVVKDTITYMGEDSRCNTGIDGCGVPVFMTTVKSIAVAFKNLARPQNIPDPRLKQTVTDYVPRINQYPHMMRGTGHLCTLINYDPNIVAKGGALGVYGLGLKEQGIGLSFKFTDGTETMRAIIILEVLKALGALSDGTRDRLMSLEPYQLKNDNDLVVGTRKIAFDIKL